MSLYSISYMPEFCILNEVLTIIGKHNNHFFIGNSACHFCSHCPIPQISQNILNVDSMADIAMNHVIDRKYLSFSKTLGALRIDSTGAGLVPVFPSKLSNQME